MSGYEVDAGGIPALVLAHLILNEDRLRHRVLLNKTRKRSTDDSSMNDDHDRDSDKIISIEGESAPSAPPKKTKKQSGEGSAPTQAVKREDTIYNKQPCTGDRGASQLSSVTSAVKTDGSAKMAAASGAPSIGSPSASPFPKDIAGRDVSRTNGKIKPYQGITGQSVSPYGIVDSMELVRRKDHKELWERFARDGYICIRNLVPKEAVAHVRVKVLDGLKRLKKIDASTGKVADETREGGWTMDLADGAVIRGKDQYGSNDAKLGKHRQLLCPSQDLLALSRHEKITAVLSMLSKGKRGVDDVVHRPMQLGPKFAWLRIKAPTEKTSEHADIYYFLVSELPTNPATLN
jgi:hypothetical protein